MRKNYQQKKKQLIGYLILMSWCLRDSSLASLEIKYYIFFSRKTIRLDYHTHNK